MTTEGLMLCVASLVPHYLMGIAGGAGIMGVYMLVCGFFQARDELPEPVWRYPLHYISFQSYAFTGLMNNEFSGTGAKWQCPCALTGLVDDKCCPSDCRVTGGQVLSAFSIEERDKWIDLGILIAMFLFYRFVFLILLEIKAHRQKAR